MDSFRQLKVSFTASAATLDSQLVKATMLLNIKLDVHGIQFKSGNSHKLKMTSVVMIEQQRQNNTTSCFHLLGPTPLTSAMWQVDQFS